MPKQYGNIPTNERHKAFEINLRRIKMTKKELNEQKHMLKVLTENKAHYRTFLTRQNLHMKFFGLPKAYRSEYILWIPAILSE